MRKLLNMLPTDQLRIRDILTDGDEELGEVTATIHDVGASQSKRLATVYIRINGRDVRFRVAPDEYVNVLRED